VNAALEGMVYRGDADYNTASGGAETLTITVNDQGNTGAGGGGDVVSTIAVNVGAIGDTPVVDSVTTPEDIQSGPIVIDRPASDASVITHFQISNITSGTLYQNDGVTQIAEGEFISYAQAQAGLRFTSDMHSDVAGGFDVRSSENGTTVADQSVAPAHSTITVVPVADTPILTVENQTTGNQDTAIALDIDIPSLVDTDGTESLGHLTLSNVPEAAVLSAGVNNGDGTWTLTSGQLQGLTITPPPLDHRDFTLTVSVTATESGNGHTATALQTIHVDVLRVYNVNYLPETAQMTTDAGPDRPTAGPDPAYDMQPPDPDSGTIEAVPAFTSPGITENRLADAYGGGPGSEIVRYEAVAMAREMGMPGAFQDFSGLLGDSGTQPFYGSGLEADGGSGRTVPFLSESASPAADPAEGDDSNNAVSSEHDSEINHAEALDRVPAGNNAPGGPVVLAPGLTEQLQTAAGRFAKERARLVGHLATVPPPAAGGMPVHAVLPSQGAGG
ncbi:MAG: hypothetical protein JEZ02_21230, partial [Desulfatibacillum sp.]|nr:hypothetical protein [Desulfatibacillum sp.]